LADVDTEKKVLRDDDRIVSEAKKKDLKKHFLFLDVLTLMRHHRVENCN
jgi:hypothetical protein